MATRLLARAALCLLLAVTALQSAWAVTQQQGFADPAVYDYNGTLYDPSAGVQTVGPTINGFTGTTQSASLTAPSNPAESATWTFTYDNTPTQGASSSLSASLNNASVITYPGPPATNSPGASIYALEYYEFGLNCNAGMNCPTTAQPVTFTFNNVAASASGGAAVNASAFVDQGAPSAQSAIGSTLVCLTSGANGAITVSTLSACSGNSAIPGAVIGGPSSTPCSGMTTMACGGGTPGGGVVVPPSGVSAGACGVTAGDGVTYNLPSGSFNVTCYVLVNTPYTFNLVATLLGPGAPATVGNASVTLDPTITVDPSLDPSVFSVAESAVQDAPEPASVALLTVGAGLLGMLRRRPVRACADSN